MLMKSKSKTQERPVEQNKQKRVLILGSASHTRLVRSYEWDKLPRDLNVADYDVVVMDFTPFADKSFANRLNIDLVPSPQQFARLLFSSRSEIVAIGSPHFELGGIPQGGAPIEHMPPRLFSGGYPVRESTWWLPLNLRFIYEMGETIEVTDRQFASYFALVRAWKFYFEGFTQPSPEKARWYLESAVPAANYLKPTLFSLANTRFGRAIAVQLSFEALRITDPDLGFETGKAEIVAKSSTAIWLPEPTETTSHEAIDLILRERYGLRFETEPPEWATAYKVPAELPIEKAINDKTTVIGQLEQELQVDREHLTQASRFRKLLFEQGEDVLEPVVRDALRILGANVEEPKKKGHEDGRLTDPSGRNGMLEIKGRTGALRLSDVRELDHWVRDAIANENWHSKGILIVNLQCDTEPQKRKDIFPQNCMDAARNFGICLVTTTQLFRALVEDQQGRLDRSIFWDAIFAANGACNLPELGK